MTTSQFDKIVNDTLKQVKNVLCNKQAEYSNKQDRLQGFKHAAIIMRTTPKQALFAMMNKHLTSIIDGIYGDVDLSLEKWDEKIIDSINYLLLLRALIIEEKEVNNVTV